MLPELFFIGLLSMLCAALVYERERNRQKEVDRLNAEKAELKQMVAKLAEAQQARVNYKTLENLENAMAQLAAAEIHMETEAALLGSVRDFLARAHTPTNGGNKA